MCPFLIRDICVIVQVSQLFDSKTHQQCWHCVLQGASGTGKTALTAMMLLMRVEQKGHTQAVCMVLDQEPASQLKQALCWAQGAGQAWRRIRAYLVTSTSHDDRYSMFDGNIVLLHIAQLGICMLPAWPP